MPRSAQDILADLPSERLRIGAFSVDATTRELTGDDGAVRRISLKALDVLLVLARQPGKVVSREHLLETIWPDTLPSDEVVTQAIGQLRRAFGDGRPAEYIETIAKHGYRLIPEVVWLDAAAVSDATPVTQSSRRTWHMGVALTLAALGLILAATWLARSQHYEPSPSPLAAIAPEPAYERLTSRPGSELWPNLSPDGAMVVYSQYSEDERTAALMVQTTAPVPPRALTFPADGERHAFPAWSPNGREIAFLRTLGGDGCRLMRIAASGGDAIDIAPCPGGQQRFGWNPQGNRLILSDNGPLVELDIASGTLHPLDYPRERDDIDIKPAFSPDGRWIAFQRNVSRSDLWRIPAEGGEPQRLTRLETNLYGFSWTPDGQAMILSHFVNHQIRLSQLDIATGTLHDLGITNATSPHVAQRAPTLVFVDGASAPSHLYRIGIPQPDGTPGSARERAFPSTGSDLTPSVSPDGRRIAFLSDRSGTMRLWWTELERPESLRPVEGFAPLQRQAPAWSANGDRLLVVGTTLEGERLYEVALPAARITALPPLPKGTPTHAAYAANPNELLVTLDEGGATQTLVRYDTRTTPWRVLAQIEDVGFSFVDAQRQRLVFTRRTSFGIWESPLDLSQPQLLDDLTDKETPGMHIVASSDPYPQGRRVVVWPGGIGVLGTSPDCALRWIPLPRDQNPDSCLEAHTGTLSTAGLDPVHGTLYYTYSYLRDYHEDIAWMPLPQVAGEHEKPPPADTKRP